MRKQRALLMAQGPTKSSSNTTQTANNRPQHKLARSTAIGVTLLVALIILSCGAHFLTHVRTSFSLRFSCRLEWPRVIVNILSSFSESALMARAPLHSWITWTWRLHGIMWQLS